MPKNKAELAERGEVRTMIRVSPRLKGKIAAAVERSQLSMNDVVVGALAEHYGVPFDQVGRKSTKPIGSTGELQLRLPRELYSAIRLDAGANAENMRNCIVRVLSAHYRVKYEPSGRWSRAA